MSSIVHLARNDPAGTAITLVHALRERGHDAHLITWRRRYRCGFAADRHVPDAADHARALRDLVAAADVLHVHMYDPSDARYAAAIDTFNRAGHGRLVLHHHGEPWFRRRLPLYRALYARPQFRDAPLLVATPDMLRLCADFPTPPRWQPNLAASDLARKAESVSIRRRRSTPALRVCQTPTRPRIKSTDRLRAACAAVRAAGIPIVLRVGRRLTHSQSLAAKLDADVVFDQMDYSFGVASLEALALGRPTICRLDADQRARVSAYAGSDALPWLLVDDDRDLVRCLTELAIDARDNERRKLRALGSIAQTFMREHWSIDKGIDRLLTAYTRDNPETPTCTPPSKTTSLATAAPR